MSTALLSMPQGAEWFVILAVFVLIFGAAKLPDLARSTGQALRIFKAETASLREDVDAVREGATLSDGAAGTTRPTSSRG